MGPGRLVQAGRLAALTIFMPFVMFHLATGAVLSWLLQAGPLSLPPPTATAKATATTTTTKTAAATASPPPPPSASRRMKRPRKHALAALNFEEDDTVPDRRSRAAHQQHHHHPHHQPPPPRPPPLALDADDLRRLQARAPAEFLCALDACAMTDPVVTPSGLTFERSCAEKWCARWGVDPGTSAPLSPSSLYSNLAVRDRIVAWLEEEMLLEEGRGGAGGGGTGGGKQGMASRGGEATAGGRLEDVDAEID
jgi:hypothetical protein